MDPLSFAAAMSTLDRRIRNNVFVIYIWHNVSRRCLSWIFHFFPVNPVIYISKPMSELSPSISSN